MPSFEALPERGTYTLIIFLSKQIRLNVGKLGFCTFPKGYYAYTGSAMGSGASGLSGRISRHSRRSKRNFWHIDFLLANENAILISVVAAQTSVKLECEFNHCIKRMEKTEIPVLGFGASDCRKHCGSHLLHFNEEDVESKIAMLYAKKLCFKPVIINFLASKRLKVSGSSSAFM
jgi:Uri superfamily endonuclease